MKKFVLVIIFLFSQILFGQNLKIPQLNPILNSDLASNDVTVISDISANESKKLSIGELDLRWSFSANSPLSLGSNVLSIPQATTSVDGYLTSSDWTTFNSKMLSPMTTGGDLIYGGASGSPTRLANGSAGNILVSSGGTSAPAWSTATYPSTTTANQILYSSATNTIGGISSAATSALVTNSSSVPSFTSGSVANRVLRTDGSSISFSSVVLSTDVTGTLSIANGGTNNSSLGVTAGGVVYADGTRIQTTSAGTSGQYLKSAGSSAPVWTTFTKPTVQVLTGSGTYTPTSGTAYIVVKMVGGGGAGAANGSGPSIGTAGGNTTFGSATSNGGGVAAAGGGGPGGAGGTNTLAYTTLEDVPGQDGSPGGYDIDEPGSIGGASIFGGGGVGGARGAAGTVPGSAGFGYGSGGGGAGGNGTYASGAGGGAGAGQVFLWTSPTAVSYSVGSAGTLGGAGGGGNNSGPGKVGTIVVFEYYQ